MYTYTYICQVTGGYKFGNSLVILRRISWEDVSSEFQVIETSFVKCVSPGNLRWNLKIFQKDFPFPVTYVQVLCSISGGVVISWPCQVSFLFEKKEVSGTLRLSMTSPEKMGESQWVNEDSPKKKRSPCRSATART